MHSAKRPGLPRREFLGTSLAAGFATGALLAGQDLEAADPNRLKVEAYTDQMSYLPGEQAAFHMSASVPAQVDLEIARIGVQREVVWRKTGVFVTPQSTPKDAALRGCGWPVTLKVPLAATLRSGLYEVVLNGRGGGRQATSEAFFIVRSPRPGKDAKILFQLSTNTYQAYNNWGGSCLYSGPKYPRISFDRPIQIYRSRRAPKAEWYNPNNNCHHTWDVPFIEWAERAGYKLDYCANLDLEFQPEMLKAYKLVLSVGHDEYWSAGMRDNLEAYIGQGGNVAFLSGNSVCWQVRVEDKGRALTCYKRVHEQDPVFKTGDHRELTTLWGDALVKRPENQLTGVGFAHGGYNAFYGEFESGAGSGEYTIHRPDHWIFAGTGLKRGDTFGRLRNTEDQPGIAGYECDGCEFTMQSGLPVPTCRDGTPRTMQIIATAPARWSRRDGSHEFAKQLRQGFPPPAPGQAIPNDPLNADGAAVLGLYERGGTVVTVGACGWSYGLAARDVVVDRIVRNVFDRLTV